MTTALGSCLVLDRSHTATLLLNGIESAARCEPHRHNAILQVGPGAAPESAASSSGQWQHHLQTASLATMACRLQHDSFQQRGPLATRQTAHASFACISAAAAPVQRQAVEGPGQALRLHAEELRAAAKAREEQAAANAVAEHRRRQREKKAAQRQRQREIVLHEGINHVKHMAAGALAACVSRTVVAPFERVKMECILRQRGAAASAVAAGILRNEGLLGFWHGNGLNILRTAPYKAMNFSSYDAYRKLLQRHGGQDSLGRGGSFLAGAMAGITAMLTCFPLDVVRTRIMAAPRGSSMAPLPLMRSIAQTEGLGGLYAGCLPALISVAPSGAVFYGTYDVLKERHLAWQRQSGQEPGLGTALTLLYGGLAGVTAETAVYPLQVVQRYMQLHSAEGAAKGVRTALSARQALRLTTMSGPGQVAARATFRFQAAIIAVYRTQGLTGFYTGILPNVMQVLPNAALSYYAYEAFKRVLAAED